MRALFDHQLVSERYFFPRADAPKEVTRIEVDGASLACAKVWPYPDDAPTLVHFHGNGETVADYVPGLAQAFAGTGCNILFVEYRGYGASTGSPALARMLDDVPIILRSLGSPPERTFVYGRSIGSIYAIEAVQREPRLGGLIVESGIADVLERVLLRVSPRELGADIESLRAEASARFDHRAKLGGYAGPALILHAERDHLVHRSHAERNAASGKRAELTLFPSGDHNTILTYNLPAIVERVGAFVRSALLSAAP